MKEYQSNQHHLDFPQRKDGEEQAKKPVNADSQKIPCPLYGEGLEVENILMDSHPQNPSLSQQQQRGMNGFGMQNQQFQPQQNMYNNGSYFPGQMNAHFYPSGINQMNANINYNPMQGYIGNPQQNAGGMGIPVNQNAEGDKILPGIPVLMQPEPMGGYVPQGQIISGDQHIRQALVLRIRKSVKWFTGCNACFMILLAINLLNKISLYNTSGDTGDSYDSSYKGSNKDSSMMNNPPNGLVKASAMVSIIEYIIWFCCILMGIHGLSSNKLHLLQNYIQGLFVCLALEAIASVLLFAGFSDWTPILKVSFVIMFLLSLLIIYSFIKNAKLLQRDINVFKEKFNCNPLIDILVQNNLPQMYPLQQQIGYQNNLQHQDINPRRF